MDSSHADTAGWAGSDAWEEEEEAEEEWEVEEDSGPTS